MNNTKQKSRRHSSTGFSLCLWGTKKMDCIFDRWIRTPEEIHAPILQVKDALSGNSFAAFAHKYSAQK